MRASASAWCRCRVGVVDSLPAPYGSEDIINPAGPRGLGGGLPGPGPAPRDDGAAPRRRPAGGRARGHRLGRRVQETEARRDRHGRGATKRGRVRAPRRTRPASTARARPPRDFSRATATATADRAPQARRRARGPRRAAERAPDDAEGDVHRAVRGAQRAEDARGFQRRQVLVRRPRRAVGLPAHRKRPPGAARRVVRLRLGRRRPRPPARPCTHPRKGSRHAEGPPADPDFGVNHSRV